MDAITRSAESGEAIDFYTTEHTSTQDVGRDAMLTAPAGHEGAESTPASNAPAGHEGAGSTPASHARVESTPASNAPAGHESAGSTPASNAPAGHEGVGSTAQPSLLTQFLIFGWQQALSCIFPVAVFASLAITQIVHIPGVHRYDLILVLLLGVQLAMYLSKLETLDEIKVICLFHFFGVVLEIFKIHVGSWTYPDPGVAKIMGVPLFSGFLYASVASYICQAWRRFDLRLTDWPKPVYVLSLGAGIYVNFFTNHWVQDIRMLLIPAVVLVFWRTWVRFTVAGTHHRMPLTLSFVMIGYFVWLAENISTFLKAWKYSYQLHEWNMVHTDKITSWFLLVIISVIGVAQLKHVKAKIKHERDPVQF